MKTDLDFAIEEAEAWKKVACEACELLNLHVGLRVVNDPVTRGPDVEPETLAHWLRSVPRDFKIVRNEFPRNLPPGTIQPVMALGRKLLVGQMPRGAEPIFMRGWERRVEGEENDKDD